MESFRSLLENKNIQLSLYYYGVQDLGTGWEIKTIVDNQEIFVKKYSKLSLLQLETIDDYYLYLLSVKLRDMRDIIPVLLQDEHKTIISQISDHAEKMISNINNGDIIKFINKNYKEIFDKDKSNQDMRMKTLDIITDFNKGIQKTVFEYLCKNYRYLIINRFDKFQALLEKNIDLFELLFPTGHLDEINSLHFEKVLSIWSNIINKNNSNLKSIVEKRTETLFEDMLSLCNSATIDNIMRIESLVSDFYLFLQQIKSQKTNVFAEYYRSTEKTLSEYISKSRQLFEYEIPVGQIISEWKKHREWMIRLLKLTHSFHNNTDEIRCISYLSIEPEPKHPFFYNIRTNVPTDDFYTLSYQQLLAIKQTVRTATIFAILQQQDTMVDYLSLISSATKYICEQINDGDNQFEADAEMLCDMIQLVVGQQNAKESIVNGLCYGTSMFICALIEKLLRVFYFNLVKDEIYVPVNKATLGGLLATSNEKMVDVFGEIHIKNLSFFLQQVPPSNIGSNIRNSLAHWSNISRKMLTPKFVSKMLWLFTDVLNTLMWYYLKDTINGDEKNAQL